MRMFLGKLLNVAQCCATACFFLTHLSEILKGCPAQGSIRLSQQFNNDLAWFAQFFPDTNRVFILYEDNRVLPLSMYIDACGTGAGMELVDEAYHTVFPSHVLMDNRPINCCHFDALNAMGAITTWAARLRGRLVHLYCDN